MKKPHSETLIYSEGRLLITIETWHYPSLPEDFGAIDRENNRVLLSSHMHETMCSLGGVELQSFLDNLDTIEHNEIECLISNV